MNNPMLQSFTATSRVFFCTCPVYRRVCLSFAEVSDAFSASASRLLSSWHIVSVNCSDKQNQRGLRYRQRHSRCLLRMAMRFSMRH